jgi:dihydrodipicolinate synthase/N-acetylneuraminate lyase
MVAHGAGILRPMNTRTDPGFLSFDDTHPLRLLAPQRRIRGLSAVLLPFDPAGFVDFEGFARHVERTAAAGIIPAVNMDTGYGHLIGDATRQQVLATARQAVGPAGEKPFGGLVAGACVVDGGGDAFNEAAYAKQLAMIAEVEATPVIFPSWGLNSGDDADVIARLAALASHTPHFIGFELARAFHPAGRVLSLDAYAELMAMPTCLGAKHSSLSRRLEWDRLALRNSRRPDFHVFTGNDLAIDMVRYGSDWLLGLSTAWPEAFALRDAWWAAGDRRFDELDDALQALGDFAFRWPVPAYKHSMAQFLHLRGLIGCDATHSQSLPRPESDREILAGLRDRIESAMAAEAEPH